MNARPDHTADSFPTSLYAIRIDNADGSFAGYYVNANHTTRTLAPETTFGGEHADRVARCLNAATMSFDANDLTTAATTTYRVVLVA